ncbi:MAG: alpha/beta fold hydrolase [Actinomycetota bacterium]|nr:alpha/beta fold hydrolase [Actinomycetota bacterium]
MEDSVLLHADLAPPGQARGGIVVFAHGSGSSRHSPRNLQVARRLQRDGFGTLLLDLLTEEEEGRDVVTRQFRFDVDLLADRLVAAVRWLDSQTQVRSGIGYFGASTGAAGALLAAAREPDRIAAVVSRGGRPDLAGEALADVVAPTLLIVGGRDEAVLTLNLRAAERLRGEHRVEVVPGATHLFEEPGALERVADLAAAWFSAHLRPSESRDR